MTIARCTPTCLTASRPRWDLCRGAEGWPQADVKMASESVLRAQLVWLAL